jgi:plasmid stabilization system protein ParE
MALEILWSKKADESFDKIIEYLSQRWGDAVVTTFVQK